MAPLTGLVGIIAACRRARIHKFCWDLHKLGVCIHCGSKQEQASAIWNLCSMYAKPLTQLSQVVEPKQKDGKAIARTRREASR